MDSNVFKAILAMDSYNRGYDQGIVLTETEDSIGIELGKALIVNESDINEGEEGVINGFYGIAYQIKDDDRTIVWTVKKIFPDISFDQDFSNTQSEIVMALTCFGAFGAAETRPERNKEINVSFSL